MHVPDLYPRAPRPRHGWSGLPRQAATPRLTAGTVEAQGVGNATGRETCCDGGRERADAMRCAGAAEKYWLPA